MFTDFIRRRLTRQHCLRHIALTVGAAFCLAAALAGMRGAPVAHAQTNAQWAHNLTSSQDIQLRAMSLSGSGEVVIAATFHGTVDFDPGAGEALLSSGSSDSSAIARYDPFGNFMWAHRLVGSGDVVINDLVVDPMGYVGVVGSFEGSADLDPGAGVFPAESKGEHDAFVLRLAPDGNLEWAWTMGDEDDDRAFGVATDVRSGLYVIGKFEGDIAFQGGGSPRYDLSSVGGTDVFAVRFNNAGRLFWARVFGGDEDDAGTDIALDGDENVYMVGTFAGEADLDPAWTSTETRSSGRKDIFISVVNVNGDSRFQLHLGGTGEERNAKLVVQENGAFIVAGEFEQRADFDMRGDGGTIDSRGGHDIFLARFGPPPARPFEWAKAIGGTHNETLAGIHQDSFANLYVLGTFGGIVDFDPNEGVSEMTSSGAADIFLAKYNQAGELDRAQQMINGQDDRARALAIGTDNAPLIGGEYSGTIDLGHGLSISTGKPDGVYNLFVAHYARDVWTPLLERAYLPGILSTNVANVEMVENVRAEANAAE